MHTRNKKKIIEKAAHLFNEKCQCWMKTQKGQFKRNCKKAVILKEKLCHEWYHSRKDGDNCGSSYYILIEENQFH